MKKIAALALVCILLAAALSGCSNDDAPAASEQSGNFLPDMPNLLNSVSGEEESTAEPEPTLPDAIDIPLDIELDATQATSLNDPFDGASLSQDAASVPDANATLAPTDTPNPFSYSFTALADTSFGFTFTYPATWKNLPGMHTVCFQESVDAESFSARVAVTKKVLPHKPKKNSDTVLKQFQSYAQIIRTQYDSKTFEFGELNSSAKFMGQNAYEIGYLAYSGNTEVEGYMICCAIDETVYVFHFCAPRANYEGLVPTMTRMRDSVALVK